MGDGGWQREAAGRFQCLDAKLTHYNTHRYPHDYNSSPVLGLRGSGFLELYTNTREGEGQGGELELIGSTDPL